MKTKISVEFEVTVPTEFAIETAAYMKKRIERIKNDLKDRGLSCSMIVIRSTNVGSIKVNFFGEKKA